MTSEVCMMNRLAVVLAADSATTVSRWVDGNREERYFKGANKIFQLSNKHPVGVMIFDSADILNVPWETIIKSFRSEAAGKSFNTVEDYAKELFNYLNENQRFFPENKQTEQIIRSAQGVAWGTISSVIEDVGPDDRFQAIVAAFTESDRQLANIAVPNGLDDENIDKALGDTRHAVSEFIEGYLGHLGIAIEGGIEGLADTSIREVIKRPQQHLSSTGLVFAGYGDHEYFPAMVEYRHYGIVNGRHIYERNTSEKIDHDKPAWISAFAQTSMTDTFSLGLSADVYESLMVAVVDTITNFAEDVAGQSGGQIAAIDDLAGLVQAARNRISQAVLDKASKDHSLPLRSVLSVLPVDEMAELAETLITLQSLKEKVTKPSETVGGPVDVAIITKHEGLVWVKRKHFFNSDINSRYQLRQAALHSQ
ncbi:hypothetical protein HGG72_09155 [Ochrobactrum pecoris]|uniref:Uncharacterized protein n=1 Tax=Brucella pecoris TaxID=867683 RepID=A0A5C5CTQ1_9HYPH|nr:hypothetical protein [Brucella pecoris]MBB4092596.1 hypothetical protein [Brucella pecoris]NKW80472.1 hypothetical protein [Brucella pecoris]TNV14421.1 hypothetical protein FIB18_04105 [Brucella pecoris]